MKFCAEPFSRRWTSSSVNEAIKSSVNAQFIPFSSIFRGFYYELVIVVSNNYKRAIFDIGFFLVSYRFPDASTFAMQNSVGRKLLGSRPPSIL